MEVTALERIFEFDNQELIDPDPSLTPKEVREILSNRYPDILNSDVSGPEMKDGKLYFTFGRNLGTKG